MTVAVDNSVRLCSCCCVHKCMDVGILDFISLFKHMQVTFNIHLFYNIYMTHMDAVISVKSMTCLKAGFIVC